MEELLWPIILLLLAALLLFLGIRYRRNSYASYEEDAERCTAAAPLTVTDVDKREEEQWEDREDGSRELMHYAIYTTTISYTVNGQNYTQTITERYAASYTVGQQITGYYDPANPGRVLLGKPKKPVLSGIAFFLGAAILVVFGIIRLYNALYWMI